MNIIYKARLLLIRFGKVLPFVLCFIVLISYAENLYALASDDVLYYNGYYVLNKPISWFVGQYFEYNISHLVVITIISVAIQTCVYNKMACLYLALNLYQKHFFATHEYENYVYYIIPILNILICTYLCYKGTKTLFTL